MKDMTVLIMYSQNFCIFATQCPREITKIMSDQIIEDAHNVQLCTYRYCGR